MSRYEHTRNVGIFGIIGNIFLLIIKLIVAFLSHSQAMIADALNSAGDIFSSIMTYIGNKIACTPSDEDHNFGHGKAEYIFSLLISIFMLFIGCKILVDSCLTIINNEKFIFSYTLIIVSLITIFTKLILYLYCKKMYKKHSNILIKASMIDHRNDMLLTTGTLVSIILGYFGFFIFDGIFGSLISIYILVTGTGIFLESYKVLMDVSLDKTDKESIIRFILTNKDVITIEDFYTLATGYKYIAIITINVDGELSTFKSHDIADTLEGDITKKFNKINKVIIHVNPVDNKQEKSET